MEHLLKNLTNIIDRSQIFKKFLEYMKGDYVELLENEIMEEDHPFNSEELGDIGFCIDSLIKLLEEGK